MDLSYQNSVCFFDTHIRSIKANESHYKKTNNVVFEQVRQTKLYKQTWLEDGNFELRK